jgi:hypothetical protein
MHLQSLFRLDEDELAWTVHIQAFVLGDWQDLQWSTLPIATLIDLRVASLRVLYLRRGFKYQTPKVFFNGYVFIIFD